MGLFSELEHQSTLARVMGLKIVDELHDKGLSYKVIARQAKDRRKRLGGRHERWALYWNVGRIARKERRRESALYRSCRQFFSRPLSATE